MHRILFIIRTAVYLFFILTHYFVRLNATCQVVCKIPLLARALDRVCCIQPARGFSFKYKITIINNELWSCIIFSKRANFRFFVSSFGFFLPCSMFGVYVLLLLNYLRADTSSADTKYLLFDHLTVINCSKSALSTSDMPFNMYH